MAAAETDRLPRYLAPLPDRVESVALQYAWVIVAINLAGTAFGFWYYIPQFQLEPVVVLVQHVRADVRPVADHVLGDVTPRVQRDLEEPNRGPTAPR